MPIPYKAYHKLVRERAVLGGYERRCKLCGHTTLSETAKCSISNLAATTRARRVMIEHLESAHADRYKEAKC